jgi:hypothetical protein
MSNHRTGTRMRVLVVAGACAAAIGLASCGGDDSSSSDVEALREEFNAGLVDAAASEGSLTDAQAECLAEKLQEGVTDEMLQAAEDAGEMTPEIQEASIQAGIDCQQE